MVGLPERREAGLARELARRARALPLPADEAQLLTYGLLAARWLGCRLGDLPTPAPLLRRAFARGARHAASIDEVLRVADLGATFGGGDPIVRFYEAFLAAWDPGARSARGVYYTPAPVVTHIVDSVAEMVDARWGGGLAGAARILDPATGTGAFLLEVVRRAREEVPARRWRARARSRLIDALAGWELMPVAHAICRLRLALALRDCGADAADAIDVRLGNALDHDIDAPAEIVVGNPPYAAYSANLEERHRAWIAGYRVVDGRRIRGRNALQVERNLNDDYVKFLALAERHATRGRRGAVGVITNHSWVDGESYAGVRASYLRSFEEVVCLDLHGNRDRRERGPGGGVDENVFGVHTGVAIVCAIRGAGASASGGLACGDLFGTQTEKLRRLAAGTIGGLTAPAPVRGPLYLFRRDDPVGAEFDAWPSLAELMPRYSAATETGFDELLIAWSREELVERVRRFAADRADPLRRWAAAARPGSQARRLADEPERLDVAAAERYARPIQFRPFDWRWAYLRREALKTHAFANMERLSAHSPGLATTSKSTDGFGALSVGGFFAHKLIQRYDRALVFPAGDLARRRYFEIIALLHAPSYGARYARRLRGSLPRIPVVADTRLASRLAELGQAIAAVELDATPVPVPAAAAAPAAVRIGSYEVLPCWLRARGERTIDAGERERVARAVAALARLVVEVDNLIVEQGGWPRAFGG